MRSYKLRTAGETMMNVAEKLAQKGETVHLNRTFNSVLGETIDGVGKFRPDALSIGKDGVISITEVLSPSQTLRYMEKKVELMTKKLEKAGHKVKFQILSETGEKLK